MEHCWRQPFRWGLLMAFDDQHPWDRPEGVGTNDIVATSTCIAVPVLHSYDVEIPADLGPDELIPEAEVEVVVIVDGPSPVSPQWTGSLVCASGRLAVGDAENGRVIDVPAGTARVSIGRSPAEFAEHVVITIAGE